MADRTKPCHTALEQTPRDHSVRMDRPVQTSQVISSASVIYQSDNQKPAAKKNTN